MPDALVERERAKRDWCKVARFDYRMGAGGASDDLPFVTPKPVLHALTEREEREGAAQLACHREQFLRIKGSYVILASRGESPLEPKLTRGFIYT